VRLTLGGIDVLAGSALAVMTIQLEYVDLVGLQEDVTDLPLGLAR
jgi:hypothetical protein